MGAGRRIERASCLNAAALSTEFCTGRGVESFGASTRIFLYCWGLASPVILNVPDAMKCWRGLPEVLSFCLCLVPFSSEGLLDNGQMRRYMGVARSRAG
jgi:hypothetical protein